MSAVMPCTVAILGLLPSCTERFVSARTTRACTLTLPTWRREASTRVWMPPWFGFGLGVGVGSGLGLGLVLSPN